MSSLPMDASAVSSARGLGRFLVAAASPPETFGSTDPNLNIYDSCPA
ncbi:MAG TPA: hypothetical protein VF553_16585 [Pyrinomonadaceae bacterium]